MLAALTPAFWHTLSQLLFMGLFCVGWFFFFWILGALVKGPFLVSAVGIPYAQAKKKNLQLLAISSLLLVALFGLLGLILHAMFHRKEWLGADFHMLVRHVIGGTVLMLVGTMLDGYLLQKFYRDETEERAVFWPMLGANAIFVLLVLIVRQLLWGSGF